MNYDITFCEGGKAFEKANATATASCYKIYLEQNNKRKSKY